MCDFYSVTSSNWSGPRRREDTRNPPAAPRPHRRPQTVQTNFFTLPHHLPQTIPAQAGIAQGTILDSGTPQAGDRQVRHGKIVHPAAAAADKVGVAGDIPVEALHAIDGAQAHDGTPAP